MKNTFSAIGRVPERIPALWHSITGGQPLENDRVKQVIADAEKELDGKGRLVIRKSGTEPLIRVMAEGEDEKTVRAVVRAIAGAIEEVAA